MSLTPRLQAIFDSRSAIEGAWSRYLEDHRNTHGHSRAAKAARTIVRRAFERAIDAVKDLGVEELRAMERRGQPIDWQGLRPRHTSPAITAPSWPSIATAESEDQCE